MMSACYTRKLERQSTTTSWSVRPLWQNSQGATFTTSTKICWEALGWSRPAARRASRATTSPLERNMERAGPIRHTSTPESHRMARQDYTTLQPDTMTYQSDVFSRVIQLHPRYLIPRVSTLTRTWRIDQRHTRIGPENAWIFWAFAWR